MHAGSCDFPQWRIRELPSAPGRDSGSDTTIVLARRKADRSGSVAIRVSLHLQKIPYQDGLERVFMRAQTCTNNTQTSQCHRREQVSSPGLRRVYMTLSDADCSSRTNRRGGTGGPPMERMFVFKTQPGLFFSERSSTETGEIRGSAGLSTFEISSQRPE